MIATKIARQLLRGVRDRRRVDRGVRILTYHGVVESYVDRRVDESFHLLRDFRAHLAILRRCNVVPLAELASSLSARSILPRVAITFDDGFRNNTIAAELLHAAKLPATFFIATANVERHEPIWPTLLRLVLARGSARTLELAGVRYELDAQPEIAATIRIAFKGSSADVRKRLWLELVGQLRAGELDELIAQFPAIEMMSWSDVRALASSGFEIGSHGAWHELHHAAQPRETRQTELATSKRQIEDQVGRAPERFAYPNGTFTDASPDDLRAEGYLAGFTMVSRAANHADDPMRLPRIVPGAGVEKMISALVFGN
ncbi:hypothetical protein BH11MYX1_BH11MYX1_45830 [soil metagenome]